MARKKEFIMSKDDLAYEEPIDGEFLNVKRTYMLKASTVRKLNELKSIHPDLNTYVSSIVDIAISSYYDSVIKKNIFLTKNGAFTGKSGATLTQRQVTKLGVA